MFELPELPTTFLEEDEERLKQLQALSKQHQELWEQHFRPDVYEDKPAWEKALRSRSAAMRELTMPPGLGWLTQQAHRVVPFYDDRTFRYVSQEVEDELRELKRRQRVATELPPILELASFAFAKGLPVADAHYLYQMFPELNPNTPAHRRLPLDRDERRWLEDWLLDLSKTPKDQIADFFVGRPLAPETWQEALERISFDMPHITPAQVMSTVAFSQDVDEIRNALSLAYPPQVADDQQAFEQTQEEAIREEMERLGLEPSGDWQKDIMSLWQKQEELARESGTPIQIQDPETGVYADALLVNDTDVYVENAIGRELVGRYDPETELYYPLSDLEAYENFDQMSFTLFNEETGEEIDAVMKLSDGTVWIDDQHVGHIDEDGSFVPRDLAWHERLLHYTLSALPYVFWPFSIMGFVAEDMGRAIHRDMVQWKPPEIREQEDWWWDKYNTRRAELEQELFGRALRGVDTIPPDKREEYFGRLSEIRDELDVESEEKFGLTTEQQRIEALRTEHIEEGQHDLTAWQMARGEIYGEYYDDLPWWGQLLYETPGWLLMARGGATPLRGFQALGKAAPKAGTLTGYAIKAGQVALAPAAGVQWVVGMCFKTVFGQFPKAWKGVSTRIGNHKFDSSHGGRAAAHHFGGKHTPEYKVFREIMKFSQQPSPHKDDPLYWQRIAWSRLADQCKHNPKFREGFMNLLKEMGLYPGATHADYQYAAGLARAIGAMGSSTGTTPDIVGNVMKHAAEKGIPFKSITGAMVRELTPEGISLAITPSLTTSLKDLGWTQRAIDAMSPEDAWTNVLAGRMPEPVVGVDPEHQAYLEGQISSLRTQLGALRTERDMVRARMDKVKPDEAKRLKPIVGDLTGQIQDVSAQISNFQKELAGLRPPPKPDEPLAPTKEMKEVWDGQSAAQRVQDLKEAGVEGKIAEAIGSKSSASLTPDHWKRITGAKPEFKPPMEVVRSLWDKSSPSVRGAIANQAGIAKTAIGKPFDDLTEVQQELIQANMGKPPEKPVVDTGDQAESKLSDMATKGELPTVRDPIASEEAARGAIGASDRLVNVGDLEQNYEAVDQLLREQLFAADHDNTLSVAYVASSRLGSVQEYVRILNKLPHKADGTIDWDAHVSQPFKEQGFMDAKYQTLQWQPTRDAFHYMDGGRRGMLSKKVFDVTTQAIVARDNWGLGKQAELKQFLEQINLDRPSWVDFKGRKKFYERTYNIGTAIDDDSLLLPVEDLLKKPAIAKEVKGLSKEKAIQLVEFSRGMRYLFYNLLDEVNAVRGVQGRDLIPRQAAYFPEVWKTTLWGRITGTNLRPEWLAEQTFAPDFIKPQAPWNPHAEQRKHGLKDYHLEKNVIKLYLDYLAIMGKEMFFTPAIGNAKAHARYLEKHGKAIDKFVEKVDPKTGEVTKKPVIGLPTLARWIENKVVQQGLVGVPDPLTRGAKEIIPPFIYNAIAWQNQRLTHAVFDFNPAFNFLVQPSSIALTVLEVGAKNTLGGLFDWIFRDDLRVLVAEEVPSYIIKQRGRASLIHQDMGTSLLEAKKIELSPIETLEEKMSFMTRFIERSITGISALAGRRDGMAKGLTDFDLMMHMSDTAAKSQSMYDPFHLPGAYPEVIRRLFRFQTFHFEAFTRLREVTGMRYLKAGAWQDVAANTPEGQALWKNRFKKIMAFCGVITLINLYGEWLTGRKPWEPSSFMPFGGTMMLPFDPGNTWNLPMPVRYIHELWRGIETYMRLGRWERLSEWALRWHFSGGAQAARMQQAIIAIIEGEVTKFDEEETPMFEINPEDWWKAVIFGTWTTEPARDYRRRMIEGYPPETHYFLDQMESKEEKLSTEMGYTLRNFRTDMLGMVEKYGIPAWQYGIEERDGVIPDLWQIIEDTPYYTPLAMYALYSTYVLDDYYDIHYPGDPSRTTRERRAYRKAYPFVDATLLFWEEVRTYQSHEAKELLELLFRAFRSAPDDYMHWTGLPEVPSWVELLDD